jgi:CelD/BcsL family acetyltransferase involved in cellulose biosynthesis
LAELEPHVSQWDGLAVRASAPFMRPEWLLAWWSAQRPINARSELRVALAFEDRDLVGVLPLHVRNADDRLPLFEMLGGSSFWAQAPLLAGGTPPEKLLLLLTEALATSSPVPGTLSLAAVNVSNDWPQSIAAVWPQRNIRADPRGVTGTSLSISLLGDFANWQLRVRRHFDVMRRLRRLDERGVTLRASTTEYEYQRDLASLIDLFHKRWAGSQQWLEPAGEVALETGGTKLFGSGGVRLWVLEGEDGIVGASLFASAGQESCFVMTAYDAAWARYSPGIITTMAGIEDAFMRGVELVDLGYGNFDYMKVMANSSRPIAWWVI